MLSGNLESFGLIDILGVIKKDRKNCILVIETHKSSYIVVYFKDGDPLFIRFVSKSFMVYLDMDFESILKREGIDKERITAVLIDRLPTFLGLKEGRFSVTSGFVRYPPDIVPVIETEKLIIFLSRNLTQQEVLRKITNEDLVFEKEPESVYQIEKLSLNDLERLTLNLVDGSRKVFEIESKVVIEKILTAGNMSGENVDDIKLQVKRALYGLLTAGIISKKIKLKKSENIFDRIINLLDIKHQKKSGV